MTTIILRYLFILSCTMFTYSKLLHLQFKVTTIYIFKINLLFFSCISLVLAKSINKPIKLLFIIMLFFFFVTYIFKKSPLLSFITTILAFGISYSSLVISCITISLFAVLFYNERLNMSILISFKTN